MRTRYRVAPKGRKEPSDAEVARYRDLGRLQYNYHRALRRWHRKPLYRDPRTFMALLLILLITWLLAGTGLNDDRQDPSVPVQEHGKEAPEALRP